MSELIKLLRGQRIDGRSTDEIMCLAADEIEHLRKEVSAAYGIAIRKQGDIEWMRGLLAEAADDIEHWGGYASEYFKDKWHLEDDIKKYRDASK